MLISLFGEFGPRRLPVTAPADGPARAARAAPVGVDDTDVIVQADAAESMRAHLAQSRGDLDQASSMITLLDPSGIWAPQVLRALSDAGAQRIEALNLREQGTLRTLAVIERTQVARNAGGPLKVYHANVRAPGANSAEIAHALAERSHLTAVIVGAMAPHGVTGLLRGLLSATRQPEWQCPWLVFILPPGANAMRQRILEQDWTSAVRVAAMSESLTGPASVWNAVLTAWEAASLAASSAAPLANPLITKTGDSEYPSRAANDDATLSATAPTSPQWMSRALSEVARTEGVRACGVVELSCGDLLAVAGEPAQATELAQLAPALCASRRAHIAAGGPSSPGPDEILVSMGTRQTVLRPFNQSLALAFIAVVDRSRANLPLLRYRLLEAERNAV